MKTRTDRDAAPAAIATTPSGVAEHNDESAEPTIAVGRARRRRDGVNSHEVARLAGVSQATVSRVINGHLAVRGETRRRVEEAMQALGYVPNAAARSLITHQTQLLGLVVSNITNGFYPEIIEAITARAVDEGYTVILGSAGERAASQARYLRLLAEQRVDGVILTSTLLGDAPDIESLVEAGLPIVLANRARSDLPIDSVALDNEAAGLAATRHLIEHGRHAIAFVGGRPDSPTDRDRFAGYEAAHREAGMAVQSVLVSHGEFTREFGYHQTLELARFGAVDGIVAGDDTIALGCLDALADAGLSVPSDVSVIGFDDIPAASLRRISLSTISGSAREMGTGALALLLERIAGTATDSPRRVVLPANLILRGSCGLHSTDHVAFEPG